MPRVDKLSDARIGIYSVGNSCPVQPQAQYEFNVSHLRDPRGQKRFTDGFKSGAAPEVRQLVARDQKVDAIIHAALLIAYDHTKTDSKWLSISFRDHHGLWTSQAVAEIVADHLAEKGFNVAVRHYANVGPAVEERIS